MPAMSRTALIPLLTLLASCAAPRPVAPKPESQASQAGAGELVGRWIFSPGDSTIPEESAASSTKDKDAKDKDATTARGVSPVGAVLSLAEGGVMFAREGDFVRRGIWKHDGVTLRLIVEPPPRRLEMGFASTIAGDRLILTGAAGMELVYHREPFVAAGRVP